MERFCKEHGLVFENPDDFRDPILDYQNDNRLPSKLSNKLAELNYRKPTPIQAVAIPIILEKRDFIGMKNFYFFFIFFYHLIIQQQKQVKQKLAQEKHWHS